MRIRFLAVPLVAIFVAGGCGSASDGKDVKSVQKCLKGIKGLKVEMAPSRDKDVKDGVIGSSEDMTNFVFAVAAHAKTDKAVKDALKTFDSAAKGGGDQVQVKSGTDGKYVWVVAAMKGAKNFDPAMKCVKP